MKIDEVTDNVCKFLSDNYPEGANFIVIVQIGDHVSSAVSPMTPENALFMVQRSMISISVSQNEVGEHFIQ